MIKTYCDICGKEITSLDKARQYKIKKLEAQFAIFSVGTLDCS